NNNNSSTPRGGPGGSQYQANRRIGETPEETSRRPRRNLRRKPWENHEVYHLTLFPHPLLALSNADKSAFLLIKISCEYDRL
ncbi:hypothetical protein L9F63_023338, partial [Diploptera punctata]